MKSHSPPLYLGGNKKWKMATTTPKTAQKKALRPHIIDSLLFLMHTHVHAHFHKNSYTLGQALCKNHRFTFISTTRLLLYSNSHFSLSFALEKMQNAICMSIRASVVICSAPVAESIRRDSLLWIAAILKPQEQGCGMYRRYRRTFHSCFPACAIQSWVPCLLLCAGARCNSVRARCQERQTTSNTDGCLCFRLSFAGC